MTNQKLFEALERVCGFTALQSDMAEIIRAFELDKMPTTETIEEAAERLVNRPYGNVVSKSSFVAGAKWQADRMYSEEDMDNLWQYVVDGAKEIMLGNKKSIGGFEEYIEQFKKK
jgi:hypothetical protein